MAVLSFCCKSVGDPFDDLVGSLEKAAEPNPTWLINDVLDFSPGDGEIGFFFFKIGKFLWWNVDKTTELRRWAGLTADRYGK